MTNKVLIILFFVACKNILFSQVLYSERFNNLSLNSATYSASGTQTYLYNDVPSGMTAINNNNTKVDTINGNYPFKANLQKQKAWLVYKPATIINVDDTFAVSSSWLNPTGTADYWLVTPTINNITANSVLSWEAMAPDAINSDGYSVYITTNTSTTSVAADFVNTLYSTASEANKWTTRGLSLAAYAGQNIRIAFRNNSTNKYQLWIDDIIVQNTTNAYDVSTLENKTYKYSTPNTNNMISAVFKTLGGTTVNNITIGYQVGSNSPVSETQFISSSLNYLDSKQLTFSTPFISSTAGYYPIKIWVSAINGQTDQNNTNDTIYGGITLSTTIPAKKVLIEEFTSATCGWCPDAYTTLKSVVNTNSNVIAVAIHNNDNMSTTEGNSLTSDYTSTYPSATIDQYYFSGNTEIASSKTNWNTYATQRQNMIVPAAVSVSNVNYNTITNQIDAIVSATFFGDVKGDYRLNLYVKENNVYGPTNDNTDNLWNQYSNSYAIPSSSYYQLGSYLNSSTYLLSNNDYMHQYVIDNIAGGAYGTSGIIPSNGTTAGQTYTMNYSYTLPSTTSGEFRYNADNIYLIGLLTEYNANTKQREVLNSQEVKLTQNPESAVGIRNIEQNTANINLFPNPATDVFNLNFDLIKNQTVNIKIYNTLGELVHVEYLNTSAGTTQHSVSTNQLPQGNYSVVVSLNNKIVTKKLTIIK